MSVRPFILLLLCLTLTLALSLSLTPVHSHPQSNNDDTQHSSATGSDTLAKPQVGTKHPQHPQKQQEVTHKHQDKTVARERPNINQGPSVRASPYHHPQDADPSSVQPPTPLSSSNITKYDDSVNGASDPSSQQVASLSPESQSQSGYGSQPDFGTPMMSQFNQSTGPVPPTYNIVNNPHRNPPRNSPPLVPDAPPMQFVQPSKNASTTIPPPSSSLAGKSNSSNGGDDDDIVTNDDPHSLPIPGSVHIPSGFPDPQRPPAASGNNPNYPSSSTRLIDQDGARDPATNDGDLPNFDPARSTRPSDHTHPPRDPHERPLTSHDHKHADEPDRIVHVTAPPSGGWRASRLRQEEHMNHQKAKHHHEKGTDKSGADGRRGGTNSYISPYGPSEEFRRNASQWMMPPDPVKLGPKPNITDPSSYQPSPAPQYWEPDAAHIAALDAERDAIHVQRVHRHGAGARTNRLASMDANSAADLSHRVVEIRNNMLFVDGAPFWIQGVCYSPVPIGESVSFAPMGDYFTPDYAYIWQRDFPLIKAMGATTLRIYGWADNADHTAFLDAVHQAGLKVLVTYYLGDAQQNPVFTQDQRNEILIRFVRQVHRYADHPAILMWSFGNELNGAWNGFTKQFSDAFNCWWQAGCAGYSDTNSDCHWQSSCMYYHLFSWINAACRAAKLVTTRPIISGFADVDYMVGPTPWLDKVARFNYVLPDMDAWAVQLYRGWTFGGYFGMYRGESQKPMIVTEFGVDAYNDACGWPENNGGGCFNMPEDAVRQGGADDNGHFWGCASGGECAKPGVQAQYEWDVRLAMELMNQYVDRGGIVWGGFLMAWTDEFWKGGGTQDLCAYPCATWDAAWCRGPGRSNYIPGGSSMCSYKAHFTCPNFDTNYHDLCGYFLSATPDNYVNEEWFGITVPVSCGLHKVNPDGVDGGYKLNSLYLRPAYIEMMQLWSGNREVDTHHTTCDALKPCWSCSVSHTIDELNDGACEKECAIKHADVGPGSSTRSINRRRNSLMNQLLHGSSDPDSLWSQFGVTLIVGLVIIGLATMISAVLWNQRQRSIIE